MEARDEDDEVFVYMGGDQGVPFRVRRARIHKSIKIVRTRAFDDRWFLISVDFQDGIEIIERFAFLGCVSLRSIKLLGIKIIKECAFKDCTTLTDVEFGDKLETIDRGAFYNCASLKSITMPSVRTIGQRAFANCHALTDLELPEGLETIEDKAFDICQHVGRLAIVFNAFNGCSNLTSVKLFVGGTSNTVASLHLERWRNEMKGEMKRINQVLPTTEGKTRAIQQWMTSVIRRLNHYKTEHQKILKEATTLLELAVWKAKIDQNEERLKSETNRERRMQRITSGASIIIKSVLPFLELK